MKNIVVLYDESRKIWVKLTDNAAYFSRQGGDLHNDNWHLIGENPTGFWISETKFITSTGYFRQVDAGAVWIEQQAGGAHTFIEIDATSDQPQNKPHEQIVLYDESRNMWVKLTDNEAYFNRQGGNPDADYWFLIAENSTGCWVSDTKFVTKTGYFRQVDGGAVWIEQQTGGAHTFVRIDTNSLPVKKEPPQLVVLYHETRKIWVKLANNRAYFNRQGGDPDAKYWFLIAENPTGYWISDTQFVTKTGYFRQKDGNSWIEQQGGTANFVRIL